MKPLYTIPTFYGFGIKYDRASFEYRSFLVLPSVEGEGGGDEAEAGGGACCGGVEPAVEVYGGHGVVGGEIAHIHVDVAPLAALGFVAGHGVGVFHLERVQVGVGAQHAHTRFQGGGGCEQVGVVEQALIEFGESLRLEGGGVGGEGVEHYLALEADVAVGEAQPHVGKPQPVAFFRGDNLLYFGDVAVGHEVEAPHFGAPQVIVFHYHESFTGGKFLVEVENLCAYGQIVERGAFVAPGHKECLAGAGIGVGGGEHVLEVFAAHCLHIVKTAYAYTRLRQRVELHVAAQASGIVQNA